jgi:CHASE3 domain sensor protein
LLYDRLAKLGEKGKGDGDDDIPPTEMSKDQGHQEVEGLRALLATERMKLESQPDYATTIRRRVEEIEKSLGEIDTKIDKISGDLPPKQGQAQVLIALQPARKLEQDIRKLGEYVGDR